MKIKLVWCLCAVVCLCALAGVAVAQQAPEVVGDVSANVDLQRFNPSPGPFGVFTLESSATEPGVNISGGLIFNLAQAPLILVQGDGSEFDAISTQAAGDLLVAVGFLDMLEVSLDVPVYAINAVELDGQQGGFALGDARLGGRVSLLDGRSAPVGLAFAGCLIVPTGDDTAFVSHGEVRSQVGVVLDKTVGPALVALNLSGLFQAENLFGPVALGSELRAGLGVQWALFDRQFFVGGELLGATSLDDVFADGRTPVEGLLGVKWRATSALEVELGAGGGILAGVGNPRLRTFVGLRYAQTGVDSDGDGILDGADLCQNQPEDVDGDRDDDGCPDRDSDGDGVDDLQDRCAEEPEDKDGFEDEDGCPDDDNDGDSVPDSSDMCPLMAGPVEFVGCPDADRDGVIDGIDECNDAPEDKDGFEDDDGCPEEDNDNDGFKDADDRCPFLAEVLNGFEDDDGCPDDGRLSWSRGQIMAPGQIGFARKKARLSRPGTRSLSAVARFLKAYPEVQGVEIQSHSANDDLELTQKRADAVKAFLVEQGIDEGRLVSKGYGNSKPITDTAGLKGRTLKAARKANERVELRIVQWDDVP